MATSGTCGTGGWTGPAAGDPDNDLTLSANTYYAGIKVSWSYPLVNPHAVAYTVIYRGTTSVFAQAIELAVVAGSVHYDQLNPTINTTYYYWIMVVSVNGTEADRIGPASAIAKPRKVDTLESLTGEIDAGVLAQSLKTEIDKITLNYAELVQEIANRVAGDASLSSAIAAVQSGQADSFSFVNQEIILRQSGDAALATQLNTVAALNSTNAAAILAEETARVTADSALASSISSVNAATVGNAAAIVTETTARTNADSALASQITTAQATLNGSISSVQTSMQTQINTVTGELDAIYTAKVDVDGMVGGFGIYGTATEVEAGFDVDQFWVGRTSADKVKPFIISGGIVYMDVARIRDADISTLKVAGSAITGLSAAEGGSGTNAGGAATTMVAAAITMPAGGSGVSITGTVVMDAAAGCTIHLSVLKSGAALKTIAVSLLGGYASTFTIVALDPSPTTGSATYSIHIENPTTGPGALVAANYNAPSIVVSGAKR